MEYSQAEILQTVAMTEMEHLDVRTVTGSNQNSPHGLRSPDDARNRSRKLNIPIQSITSS